MKSRGNIAKASKPGFADPVGAIRVNITLPPLLRAAAERVIREKGFSGLSDYIQARIRKDANLELAA